MQQRQIQHNKPFIDQDDIASVEGVLRSGWLARGKQVERFESEVAKFVGRRYAIATSSGTTALHLILLGLGVSKGDEVIMPTYVCSAVLNAINYVGATPVIVDVSDDFNVSPQGVANAITPRTKAIIGVHTYGIPFETKPLLKMGPYVIEDCAQALGSTYLGKPTGAWGTAAFFSFYATKVIATGYGGMIVTDEEGIYNLMTDLRRYDMPKVYKIRYNYEMGDIQAVLGLSQLSKLPTFIGKRRAIADGYSEAIKNGQGTIPVRIPQALFREGNIFYRYVILSKSTHKLMAALKERGIEVINPLQRFELLHRYLKLPPEDFPVAESLVGQTLSLPIYPALVSEEVDYICNVLREMVRLEGLE
jgi:perosamine synthetase